MPLASVNVILSANGASSQLPGFFSFRKKLPCVLSLLMSEPRSLVCPLHGSCDCDTTPTHSTDLSRQSCRMVHYKETARLLRTDNITRPFGIVAISRSSDYSTQRSEGRNTPRQRRIRFPTHHDGGKPIYIYINHLMALARLIMGIRRALE